MYAIKIMTRLLCLMVVCSQFLHASRGEELAQAVQDLISHVESLVQKDTPFRRTKKITSILNLAKQRQWQQLKTQADNFSQSALARVFADALSQKPAAEEIKKFDQAVGQISKNALDARAAEIGAEPVQEYKSERLARVEDAVGAVYNYLGYKNITSPLSVTTQLSEAMRTPKAKRSPTQLFAASFFPEIARRSPVGLGSPVSISLPSKGLDLLHIFDGSRGGGRHVFFSDADFEASMNTVTQRRGLFVVENTATRVLAGMVAVGNTEKFSSVFPVQSSKDDMARFINNVIRPDRVYARSFRRVGGNNHEMTIYRDPDTGIFVEAFLSKVPDYAETIYPVFSLTPVSSFQLSQDTSTIPLVEVRNKTTQVESMLTLGVRELKNALFDQNGIERRWRGISLAVVGSVALNVVIDVADLVDKSQYPYDFGIYVEVPYDIFIGAPSQAIIDTLIATQRSLLVI